MRAESLPRCEVAGKAMRTEIENNAWLSAYRERKTPVQPRLRGYKCEACDMWHVTHIQSKIVKKRIQKMARRGRL